MKITLSVAGGLAPSLMGRDYQVETSALGQPQQRALLELVAAAAKEPQRSDPGARDARTYEIRILDEGRETRIVTHDGGVSPVTRQLIAMITSLAGD